MLFSLRKLKKQLNQLEELTMQCMKCGICQAVCPLYEKDLLEQSVSRGKISLIEALFEGRIDKTDSVIKYLDYCILCGRCKRFCPSSVKTDEIFVKAKSALRKVEKLPAYQRAAMKVAVGHGSIIDGAQPLLSAAIKTLSKKGKDGTVKPLFLNRYIAPIKSESFISHYRGLNKAKSEKTRVIFYPGCAINYIYTHWGVAVVEVLNAYGVSVYVPQKNICCGIPAATMGDDELYAKMVKKNIEWFNSIKDAEAVITACPTCQWALSDLGERVTGLRINIPMLDILVYIKEKLNISLKPERNTKSTLHIPCHYDHSKDSLLENIIKNELTCDFEPLKNDSCCGFGGTFSLKYATDSAQVGSKKVNEIAQKGFKTVYSPCPGCVMQLADLCSRKGLDARVKHPIETIHENIKKGLSNE